MPSLFSPQALAPYVQQVNQGETDSPQVEQKPEENKKKGLPPLMMAGLVGSNLFDAKTTQDVLNHSKGGHEQNPFLPENPAAMYGIKGGLGILDSLVLNNLSKQGHPTLAKGLGLLGMAIPTLAGIHNMGIKKNK